MKIYKRVIWVIVLSLIFQLSSNLTLTAQKDTGSKGKLTGVQAGSTTAEKEKAELNEVIEKTIENEKFIEKEHAEMHEKDETEEEATGKPQFSDEKKHIATAYGQIKNEEAKKKLQIANTNLMHAEAALLRAEESIANAKEKLLQDVKEKRLSEAEVKIAEQKIEKAEKVLKEGREKFKYDLRNINSKLQKVN